MTYALGALCLLLPLCWLSGFAVGRSDARARRAAKRPGYVQRSLSAYGYASPTTATTRRPAATSTASKMPPEATLGRDTYPGRVKISSPSDSGSDTVFRLGGRMTGADAA